jgi:hypothetical protein
VVLFCLVRMDKLIHLRGIVTHLEALPQQQQHLVAENDGGQALALVLQDLLPLQERELDLISCMSRFLSKCEICLFSEMAVALRKQQLDTLPNCSRIVMSLLVERGVRDCSPQANLVIMKLLASLKASDLHLLSKSRFDGETRHSAACIVVNGQHPTLGYLLRQEPVEDEEEEEGTSEAMAYELYATIMLVEVETNKLYVPVEDMQVGMRYKLACRSPELHSFTQLNSSRLCLFASRVPLTHQRPTAAPARRCVRSVRVCLFVCVLFVNLNPASCSSL